MHEVRACAERGGERKQREEPLLLAGDGFAVLIMLLVRDAEHSPSVNVI